MQTRILQSIVALTTGTLILTHATNVRTQSEHPHLYVSATDGKGKPVKALSKADFSVTLDGATQEVLSAVPATEPPSIVLLTDRLGLVSSYPAYEAHTALGNFVKGVRAGLPDSKFGLMTFDGTVITLNNFTSGPAELDRNLGKLTSMSQDAVITDGLLEATRLLRTTSTPRKVIFVVVAGYRPDQSNVRNDVITEALRLSGAQLWVIEVRSAQGGNWANNVREQVLDHVSHLSGGVIDIVSAPAGLEAQCKQMAEMIAGQYDVTYGPGGGAASSQLNVTVKQPGVKVVAPIWTDR